MEKIIELKNNLIVKLVQTERFFTYRIDAYDMQGERVGIIVATLKKTFSRPLSHEQKRTYCKIHEVELSEAPNEKDITVGACDSSLYSIDGDTLTFLGNEYKYKDGLLHIDKIEVLDKRFFKVGLGYNLLKHVEEIARMHNCSRIEGFYYPHGDFRFGTYDFYKRNGFEFEKRYGNMPYIYKPLLEKVQEKNALIPVK